MHRLTYFCIHIYHWHHLHFTSASSMSHLVINSRGWIARQLQVLLQRNRLFLHTDPWKKGVLFNWQPLSMTRWLDQGLCNQQSAPMDQVLSSVIQELGNSEVKIAAYNMVVSKLWCNTGVHICHHQGGCYSRQRCPCNKQQILR